MATDLDNIKTIVIVMMENRSFDHMMGYLSRDTAFGSTIEGFIEGNEEYHNPFKGNSYNIFEVHGPIVPDPPHERENIELQIGNSPRSDGTYPMGGFIDSYALKMESPTPEKLKQVMGFHTAKDVPVYDFFARNFAICDHWFAPIPSGTQPNRLMALSGQTHMADNASKFKPFLKEQPLVYDWLEQNNVSWRCYYGGFFPFIALMPDRTLGIFGDKLGTMFKHNLPFQKYDRFKTDWMGTGELPKVIFIEPEYTDGIFVKNPNDDHSPTDVKQGQIFIKEIYETLISNQSRWKNTVMIVTYDENGGFYDHVSPLPIKTEPPTPGMYNPPFNSTGVRVPAFIVTPWVKQQTVYKEPLDHTSILYFIAQCFTEHKTYSPVVDQRQKELGGLISSILNLEEPRLEFTQLRELTSLLEVQPQNLSQVINHQTVNTDAYLNAANEIMKNHPDLWSYFRDSHYEEEDPIAATQKAEDAENALIELIKREGLDSA